MPSALYLLGREVESLTHMDYIEPRLKDIGIKVPDKAIVPVTDVDFFKSSILLSLTGDEINDPKLASAVLQAYSEELKKGENGQAYCFDKNKILECKCDESTGWQDIPLPARLHQLAYFADVNAASECFLDKYKHYISASVISNVITIDELENRLGNIQTATGSLEERLKKMANALAPLRN